VDNNVVSDATQDNSSVTYLFDYQFQQKIDSNGTFVAGASTIYADVNANLFGIHRSFNPAVYAQADYKFFKKLFVTAGIRAEYFEIDGKRGDSDYNALGTTFPVYPIFRAATSYQLLKGTFLRSSFGQGARFPSVAERFTQTSVGALNIWNRPIVNSVREVVSSTSNDAYNITTTDFIPSSTKINYTFKSTKASDLTYTNETSVSPGKFGCPTYDDIRLNDNQGQRILVSNSNSTFLLICCRVMLINFLICCPLFIFS
jgi:outer membrane receptor protein involved in Fe transport